MKVLLSVLLVVCLVTVMVHCSSSHTGRINKRYYDAWDGDNVDSDAIQPTLHRHKLGPCDNKPLWFLKSQARLGKLSPFYDCLHNQAAEKK